MMWKICGGVTYNLHNRHRKTALKLLGKKNKQTELHSKKKRISQICGESKWGLHHQHTNTCNPKIPIRFRSGFTHFFYLLQIYIHTQSEKGKISSFPPVLDFKLICF